MGDDTSEIERTSVSTAGERGLLWNDLAQSLSKQGAHTQLELGWGISCVRNTTQPPTTQQSDLLPEKRGNNCRYWFTARLVSLILLHWRALHRSALNLNVWLTAEFWEDMRYIVAQQIKVLSKVKRYRENKWGLQTGHTLKVCYSYMCLKRQIYCYMCMSIYSAKMTLFSKHCTWVKSTTN